MIINDLFFLDLTRKSFLDDDDDFEVPARANRSQTAKNKEKPTASTKLKLTFRIGDKNSKDNNQDSTLDLFGDSLDESMIAAACRTINDTAAPVAPQTTNKPSSHGPQRTPLDHKISSQFNIDLEDLLSEKQNPTETSVDTRKTTTSRSTNSTALRGKGGDIPGRSRASGEERLKSSQFDINLDELLESDPSNQGECPPARQIVLVISRLQFGLLCNFHFLYLPRK